MTGAGAESLESCHGFNALGREAHVAEFGDEIACPAVDVMFLHDPPHAPHSRLAFLGGQFERDANGLGHLLDVVRINDQGVI